MSNQTNLGRPWTPHEDNLLSEAVRIHGENTEKWKVIALFVPGRTNKACRKRWLHSLSPNVKKSAWTAEEDGLLLSLFDKHPNKWSQIAREIQGRTDDACSKRYREALDPRLKKDDWTEEEDKMLLALLGRQCGTANPKWGLIGQELGRSGLGCRNRWRLLERKKNAAARQIHTRRSDMADAMPRFLSDAWTSFAEPTPYWTSPWEPLSLCTPGGGVHGGLDLLSLTSANASLIGDGSQSGHSVTPQQAISFSYSSSSLSTALSEAQQEEQETQGIHSSPSSTPSSSTLQSPLRASADLDPLHGDFSAHLPLDNEILFPSGSDASAQALMPTVTTCVPLRDEATSSGDASAVCISTEVLSNAGDSEHTSVTSVDTSVDIPLPVSQQKQPQIRSQSYLSAGHPPIRDTPSPRKRQRTFISEPPFRIATPQGRKEYNPPKLSSKLPVAFDTTLLAYVCGHSACWKAESSLSTARYATSGELSNHFKEQHVDDPNGCEETPFRCGLLGCNKAWKSVNGLQYHLQISKAHYRRVLSTLSSERKQTTSPTKATTNAPIEGAKSKRKLHMCPFTDCPNQYKQLSGLRYHLLHGHPKNPPTQLDFMPPTIARQHGVATETISL